MSDEYDTDKEDGEQEDDDEEEEYEVERVLDRKVKKGDVFYLIRWKNYSSDNDTWEPEENLLGCEDLIQDYESRKLNQKETKHKSKHEENHKTKEKRKESKKKLLIMNSSDEEEAPKPKKKKEKTKHNKDETTTNRKEKKRMSSELKSDEEEVLEDENWTVVDEVEEGELVKSKKKRGDLQSHTSDYCTDSNKPGSQSTVLNLPPLVTTKLESVETPQIEESVQEATFDDDDDDILDFDSGLCVIEDYEAPDGERSAVNSSQTEEKPRCPSTENCQNGRIEDEKPATSVRRLSDLPSAMLASKGMSRRKKSDLTVFTKNSDTSKEKPKEKTPPPEDKKTKKSTTEKDSVSQALEALPEISSIEESVKFRAMKIGDQAIQANFADLERAVTEGDTNIVAKILLHERCPDVNDFCQKEHKITLLMISAKKGFGDICGLLVRRGAIVNFQNSFGHTALMYAVEYGNVASASVLINSGAYLNVTNIKGETALIRSVKRGQRACVELLIHSGANFSAMSSTAKSAMAIAQKLSLLDIQKVLTSFSQYVTELFEKKVLQYLNGLATIFETFFPLHVLSLCEAEQFLINFYANVPAVKKQEANILFMANGIFQDGKVHCIMAGDTFVEAGYLNGVAQQSLTQEGNFIMSLSPMHDGENKLVLNTKSVQNFHKMKLLVRGFRVKLTS